MKTKSLFLKTFILAFVVAGLLSCSKSATVKPTPSLASLSGLWSVDSWGGVTNNPLTFNIDMSTAIGTVTLIGSQPLGWVVGDKLLTGITANSDGSFSATGKYTYASTT